MRVEAGDKEGPVEFHTTAWVSPGDQRTVLIHSTGGDCDRSVGIKVRERPDTVKIAITVWVPSGPCTARANDRGYKVVLHEPLGNRKLVGIDDVAYARTSVRPQERSTGGGEQHVPVTVEYE